MEAALRLDPAEHRAPGRLAASHDVVRVFEEDPDLLADVDAPASEVLRRRAVVQRAWIEPGCWDAPVVAEAHVGHLGLLVLDGLLLRSLRLDGRDCPELVGAGDLLRPWDQDTGGFVATPVTWTALERTTVAVLDARFAAAICQWPAITCALLARSVRRSRALAFHLAVAHVRHAETRLHMLLWHLADRWGRVTPAGVHVPLCLTHETLAHLVCMRRPTASSALQRLIRADQVARRPDGTWLLTGEPPASA